MEMLAIVVVILLMFFSTYVGVLKRGEDLAVFKRSTELQGAADRVSSFLGIAQTTEGVRLNTTLPTFQEACTPEYTVYEGIFVAACGPEAYVSTYRAANVTNGTAQPPFTVSGDVAVENKRGKIVVTP